MGQKVRAAMEQRKQAGSIPALGAAVTITTSTMKPDNKTLRRIAAAQLKESDALYEQWAAFSDAVAAKYGGGPPWATVNVPEGATYLAGAAWSHWPAEVRSRLLEALRKAEDSFTAAFHTYKASRGRSWHTFRNEHSARFA